MVSDRSLDPIGELLVRAWHDAETIRDMHELFTEEKVVQIAGAAMAEIDEVWRTIGHTKRDLEDAYARLVKAGCLENWTSKKHVSLD